ncbi:hypothetical protein HMPREF3155_00190 [Corynebacterium sp. HMSC06D04]|uniref:hypothetical protein n=1 Tax=Corynebacterium sp. HMSC06D04 TaxID=1581123 RepID=UPI0008A5C278|nr:hypothetical protein [Corynebacterium sp. HMSC06D04]OFT53631.1 hypothetical protein HMPREF3155_00190 [Corynebacterium sp. HMSC06D04]
MPILIIALVLAAAGVALLLLDKRQRTNQLDGTSSIESLESSERPTADEPREAETFEPQEEGLASAENAVEEEPASVQEPAPVEKDQAAPETAMAEQQAAPERKNEHLLRARDLVPGSLRRERKAWGEHHQFEYTKQDDYLADEWMRGAAALGAAPKDIVAGFVHGHEMLLMDLGGINVMAMRTGAASDIVVDFRRIGLAEEHFSEDLIKVDDVEGFEMFATDAGVGKRLIDERLEVALEQMPEEVTAAWMESEWVLAQTTKHARGAQWDAMLAPLAKLADCARVLPPRSAAMQVLRMAELDPSREIPEPPQPEPTGPTLVPDREEIQRPHIQRPEEPVELPSRTRSESLGEVDHSALGADEVDAIADGRERPLLDKAQARMRRDLNGRSTIFGDEEANE